jgi:colanic acid biosynthesis glycosyl transferase WcaI
VKLLLHDYPGHAFTLALSRELADRGWDVEHVYSSSFTGPKGQFGRSGSEKATLALVDLSNGEPFEKYRYARRWLQERRYAHRLRERIERTRPDIVLSGNAPLDMHASALRASAAVGAACVFWVQDLYGLAIKAYTRGVLGWLASSHYSRTERLIARRADGVVLITDAFAPHLGLDPSDPRVDEIPNWAPIDEIPALAIETDWARSQDLADSQVVLYSGTLGKKHDPAQLSDLALGVPSDRVKVVVVSEGLGADWLRENARHVTNLKLVPFQAHEMMPQVLASADVLVALLEPQASALSVPSKVLAYLCAGRPIVLSAPSDNQASRMVQAAAAGAVVAPGDSEALVAAVTHYLTNPDAATAAGRAGRAFAERTFDIDGIAARFDEVLRGAIERRLSKSSK